MAKNKTTAETFDVVLSAIGREGDLTTKTDAAYKAARETWLKVDKAYQQLRGNLVSGDMKSLIQKYLPKALALAGVPGGAGIATWVADKGAFDGLFAAVKGLLPLFTG